MSRAPHVFSLGYEGKTLDLLVASLSDQRVDVLIDVRLTPWSRRPGFSKSALEQALGDRGIAYQHEPLLGNPPENREPFRSGDVRVGRRSFKQRLDNGSASAMERVASIAASKRVAILCVEDDEDRCHRQVIVESLSAANPNVPVSRL